MIFEPSLNQMLYRRSIGPRSRALDEFSMGIPSRTEIIDEPFWITDPEQTSDGFPTMIEHPFPLDQFAIWQPIGKNVKRESDRSGAFLEVITDFLLIIKNFMKLLWIYHRQQLWSWTVSLDAVLLEERKKYTVSHCWEESLTKAISYCILTL